MTAVSGWGRYPIVDTEFSMPRTIDAIRHAMTDRTGVVARGNGRAYGDAAIGVEATIVMTAHDRIRTFDAGTGLVTAEAGLTLADLIATFLPRGFFPFVVPGTRFVTVGGAIAADVHGKNHHREGGFGDHVESLVVVTADGETIRASRSQNPDVFAASIGGMGLTGMIVEATLRLRPVETGWMRQRTMVAPDLSAALAALDANDDATYSVAWIDCAARGAKLGRSLVFLGEHAHLADLDDRAAASRFPKIADPRIAVPLDFPSFALNSWSVRGFNELYFQRGAARGRDPFLVRADSYFFPLDGIKGWNRIYGRRGFVQHQCVLPADRAPAVLADLYRADLGAWRCVVSDRAEETRAESGTAVVSRTGLYTGARFPGETRHPRVSGRTRRIGRRGRRTALSRQGCASVPRDVRGRLSEPHSFPRCRAPRSILAAGFGPGSRIVWAFVRRPR